MMWAYGLLHVVLLSEGLNYGSHEVVMSYRWVEFLQILYRRTNRRDASGYHRLLTTNAIVQHLCQHSATNKTYF
jgi:hypothetical protein